MELFAVSGAICTGISAALFFLLAADLLRKIRLDTEKEPELEFGTKPFPAVFRLWFPLAGNVSFLFKNETASAFIKKTGELLGACGYDTAYAEKFFAARIFLGITGLVFLILFGFAGKPSSGLILFLCCAFYPGVWLKTMAKKRSLEILKALPNILDLLTLSVEAGKDFMSALRDIMARRKQDSLGVELIRVLHEIQLGKTRTEALREMSSRVRQPELTSVVNAIIQSDELGVSIGQVLRIQGDQLRMKRFSYAEKLANEAPVKILFPIIVFIFPAVFIILIAPIIIQAMNSL